MKRYIILHTHKHGTCPYTFQTERNDVPLGWHGEDTDLAEDEVLAGLLAEVGCDFEPDKGEYLDIVEDAQYITTWE